jgi:uncharacterized protein YidB (DUF937 family)
MSILSNLTGALEGTPAAGTAGAAASGGLATQIIGMIQNHPGGLGGMLQSFQQSGLGHVFQSWVGTGQNLPVNAEQLRNSLGSGWISKIAQATGLPADQIEQQLSNLLPQIVDHLTPHGQLPQGDLGTALAGAAQRFTR